jgi:hypothetical protein
MPNAVKSALIASAVATLFAAGPTMAKPKTGAKRVKCAGVNKCAGKGTCKGAKNDCGAKNSCRGLGWVIKTEKACAKAGGKVVAQVTLPVKLESKEAPKEAANAEE